MIVLCIVSAINLAYHTASVHKVTLVFGAPNFRPFHAKHAWLVNLMEILESIPVLLVLLDHFHRILEVRRVISAL
jgi:hypothetical protein